MKIYKELENGYFECEGSFHPPTQRELLEKRASLGTAKITPYKPSARDMSEDKRNEAIRAFQVGTIRVGDYEFDSGERSLIRIISAVYAAEITGREVIPGWKMADNSIAKDVPVSVLKEAVAALWDNLSGAWLSS